ncbi:MAG TPA: hypothetical protein VMZ53_00300 [Kofleriaceae bacterium]|nr:hypothetical protein [Kofleriaceae bacterium]
MTNTLTAFIAISIATVHVAAADSKAKPAPTKPTAAKPAEPKREPTDAKPAQLIGRWEGTSEFKIRGKTTTWKGTGACERAAISPAITCAMVGVSGDMRIEELWMLGYDDRSATYHLFSTNSWGEAYDHAAKWSDASTVSFVHSATRDGKPLVETYTLTFKGDQMIWHGVQKVGDEVIGDGTTTFKRVP